MPHICNQLVANRNPLRIDPTRTTGIQRQFVLAIRAHFRKLRILIREFIDTADALALRQRTSFVRMQIEERQFEFATDANKLDAFNQWLAREIQVGNVTLQAQNKKFIEAAYKRGQNHAFFASKQRSFENHPLFGGLAQAKRGDFSSEQFLRQAFSSQEALRKVQLLATRSFEQLKGINAQMAADMNRILAQGMAEGKNPRTIAKEMSDRIAGLSRARAELIARTEIVRAHAEGTLDAFERLGVEELGIEAEWVTAGDDRVCPQCAGMEGQTFTIEEARGLIPAHVNCRCNWVPLTK